MLNALPTTFRSALGSRIGRVRHVSAAALLATLAILFVTAPAGTPAQAQTQDPGRPAASTTPASSARIGAAGTDIGSTTEPHGAVVGSDQELAEVMLADQVDIELLGAPDTSSPWSTLQELRTNADRAFNALITAYSIHRDSPGFGTRPQVSAIVEHAELHLRRAGATLDLDKIPLADRRKTALTTVIYLSEILRLLPPLDSKAVPGADGDTNAQAPVASWTIPNSQLKIVRITEGPRTGEYLFAPQTVNQVQPFYTLLRQFIPARSIYRDFVSFYRLTPGDLLPSKWFLWIEALPAWSRSQVFGQTVWQWTGVLCIALLLLGAWWLLLRLALKNRGEDRSLLLQGGINLTLIVLLAASTSIARWLVDVQINLTGPIFLALNSGLDAIILGSFALGTYVLLLFLADWLISTPRINSESLDASLLRVSARVVGIAAAVAVLFYGSTEIGISLYGVVAGLGVGGLALGLAARPTLENLIGGLTIYADRPVRVGEYCQVGDTFGVVEEIGLRSTRIRADNRTIITIPNADFSNMQIVNWNRCDQFLIRMQLELRYGSTAKSIRDLTRTLHAYLLESDDINTDNIRVRVREIGEYAIGLEVKTYVKTTSYTAFLKRREDILLAILEIVEASDVELAYPTTTSHLVADSVGRAEDGGDPITRLAALETQSPRALPKSPPGDAADPAAAE